MINWRDVRSQSELDGFTKDFETLPAADQHLIRSEMVKFLDGFKGFDDKTPGVREIAELKTVVDPRAKKRPPRERRPRTTRSRTS